MTANDTPLPERVALSFQELKAAAAQLNAVSGELGKPIAALDEALKRLNLGVAAWVKIRGGEDPRDGSYRYLEIGYAKVGHTWGIAVRERSGNEYDDYETGESWLFANAPRIHRIDAVDKLPELLAQLTMDAAETTEKLREKIVKAEQIAAAFGERRPSAAAQAAALEEMHAKDAAEAPLKPRRK